MIVPGGGFLLLSSCVPGSVPGGMVFYEIDTYINASVACCYYLVNVYSVTMLVPWKLFQRLFYCFSCSLNG